MNKIIITIFMIISGGLFSQVAIGKTAVASSSASLDFGSENRGLVLPWVTSADDVTGAVDGTLVYDIDDNRVKLREAGAWKDLSIDATGAADTSLQDLKTESTSGKVVIGSNGDLDTTPGILVLSDINKAMILPKVQSPHLNIMDPAPGMIVYDTVTRQLAVYNGTVWSFWKPE